MSYDQQQRDESSLRRRLKELTAPFHTELESTPIAIRLASGTIGREEYGLYLERMVLIHRRIELPIGAMAGWHEYGIDPLQRSRLGLLEKDLAALGNKTPTKADGDALDVPLDFATAVGMMYVLEGSTMGGQVLTRKLSHIVDSEGVACTRYFAAYGEDTMKRWGEYCRFLEQYGAQNPNRISAVILGACRMYLMIHREMDAFR